MGYQSKTYSLSDEVVEWLEGLKAEYGSYSKGLTVLMGNQITTVNNVSLDAVGPKLSDGRGKASSTVRQPLLKPSQKGKGGK